jgi:hypothetical protein
MHKWSLLRMKQRIKVSSISMKHEIDFDEVLSAGKRTATSRMCTGMIAEMTALCDMLMQSLLFGPELLSSRFSYRTQWIVDYSFIVFA